MPNEVEPDGGKTRLEELFPVGTLVEFIDNSSFDVKRYRGLPGTVVGHNAQMNQFDAIEETIFIRYEIDDSTWEVDETQVVLFAPKQNVEGANADKMPPDPLNLPQKGPQSPPRQKETTEVDRALKAKIKAIQKKVGVPEKYVMEALVYANSNEVVRGHSVDTERIAVAYIRAKGLAVATPRLTFDERVLHFMGIEVKKNDEPEFEF